MRKIVECKESRIGKQPIPVPANVTLTMDGQYFKAKGPLGELDLTYPREIMVDKEESGVLRVRKTVETRRANQMHGLFRHFSLFSPLTDVLISHFSAILYMVTYYARYNVLLALSRESRSLCNDIGINSVCITSLVSSYITGVN